MTTKLRDYHGNQLFQITWIQFLLLLVLFLANIGFYIVYLNRFLEKALTFTNGYLTPGIIFNLYSIGSFYLLFKRFKIWPSVSFLKNNTVSAILILLISAAAFFILSPFYEKEDLLIVPAGVDFVDLFLAAVFEEIFFRVFILGIFIHLLSRLSIRKRLWLSILGTACIFTIGHFFSTYYYGSINLFTYASLLVFSIGTSWIYIKYSNLILVVYVHFLGNFIFNYLPLKTPGYGAGYLFLIFLLLLFAARGNKIKIAISKYVQTHEQNVKLTNLK